MIRPILVPHLGGADLCWFSTRVETSLWDHRVVHRAVRLFMSQLLLVCIATYPWGMARLNWPGWLLTGTYRDALPVQRQLLIQVLTGPGGVGPLRWLTQCTNHYTMLPPVMRKIFTEICVWWVFEARGSSTRWSTFLRVHTSTSITSTATGSAIRMRSVFSADVFLSRLDNLPKNVIQLPHLYDYLLK